MTVCSLLCLPCCIYRFDVPSTLLCFSVPFLSLSIVLSAVRCVRPLALECLCLPLGASLMVLPVCLCAHLSVSACYPAPLVCCAALQHLGVGRRHLQGQVADGQVRHPNQQDLQKQRPLHDQHRHYQVLLRLSQELHQTLCTGKLYEQQFGEQTTVDCLRVAFDFL